MSTAQPFMVKRVLNNYRFEDLVEYLSMKGFKVDEEFKDKEDVVNYLLKNNPEVLGELIEVLDLVRGVRFDLLKERAGRMNIPVLEGDTKFSLAARIFSLDKEVLDEVKLVASAEKIKPYKHYQAAVEIPPINLDALIGRLTPLVEGRLSEKARVAKIDKVFINPVDKSLYLPIKYERRERLVEEMDKIHWDKPIIRILMIYHPEERELEVYCKPRVKEHEAVKCLSLALTRREDAFTLREVAGEPIPSTLSLEGWESLPKPKAGAIRIVGVELTDVKALEPPSKIEVKGEDAIKALASLKEKYKADLLQLGKVERVKMIYERQIEGKTLRTRITLNPSKNHVLYQGGIPDAKTRREIVSWIRSVGWLK